MALTGFSRFRRPRSTSLIPTALVLVAASLTGGPNRTVAGETAEVTPPVSQRFAESSPKAAGEEVPDFQRHIVPLLGRLGCSGRSCHGSFQGQGGFRLSLFGYDFKFDHEQLTEGEEPRATPKDAAASLMLQKPTVAIPHEGGRRMDVDSWEYRVLARWIEGGALPAPEKPATLLRLEVTPSEIVFTRAGETSPLQAVAVWSDGSREDVTPLCRYQSNDDQIAEMNSPDLVTAGTPGDTHVVLFYDRAVVPVPVLQPVSKQSGDDFPQIQAGTEIDRHVLTKLRKLGIVPSETCTDAEFLRRVSLDLTGTLPTAKEVEAFLADSSADKRARKVDELLERPTWAAWWATRLCDITSNNGESLNNVTPARDQAVQEWYDWIRDRLSRNVPYDELAAGIILGKSRNEGESFTEYATAMSDLYGKEPQGKFADREYMPYFWARRTVREPTDKALSVAYSFLGIRIQCAQCHKHPFDQWTKQDFEQFTGFFQGINFGSNPDARDEIAELNESLGVKAKRGNDARREYQKLLGEGKVVPFDEVYITAPRPENPRQRNRRPQQRRGRGQRADEAKLLGGEVIDLTQFEDPRQPLMDWLRDPRNPYFARAFVNRAWAALFHSGIVEPPDDMSLANPPRNAELLDWLTADFIASGYNIRHLLRTIALSDTYQRSWQPNDTNRLDERNFSRAVPRRLPAEVVWDILRQATARTEAAVAMQTSLEGRAIALAGPSRRNTDYALTIFGRSTRESNCDCDRSMEASLLQTVFLRNDQEVATLLSDPRNSWVAEVTGTSRSAAADRPQNGRRGMNPANFRQQVKRIQQRIAKLKQDGNTEQASRLEERLSQLRSRFEDRNRGAGRQPSPEPRPATQEKKKPADGGKLDMDQLIREAYLRTLSRPPSDSESNRSRE
ncbi:MAG: DUF1549 domain-containing protein, partial [Planctomycetaceae bacterium]|nr:DUF1549 domain-containing protein [Planctomycetaceae bacterium]